MAGSDERVQERVRAHREKMELHRPQDLALAQKMLEDSVAYAEQYLSSLLKDKSRAFEMEPGHRMRNLLLESASPENIAEAEKMLQRAKEGLRAFQEKDKPAVET